MDNQDRKDTRITLINCSMGNIVVIIILIVLQQHFYKNFSLK